MGEKLSQGNHVHVSEINCQHRVEKYFPIKAQNQLKCATAGLGIRLLNDGTETCFWQPPGWPAGKGTI